MIVRFGFVAMSTVLENASPSRTMTYKSYSKLGDREAAWRRLEKLAAENLHNTLRLLKHCAMEEIQVYRFSSKLIPLATHEELADWDPFAVLGAPFEEIGAFVAKHRLRVSFHPDHFCVFSTPRPEVLEKSARDLEFHVRMLEAMKLPETAKCNIHIGGAYGDKSVSGKRFILQFGALPARLKNRVTLENDDKTFTVRETLAAAEAAGVPMVLDIHHHAVNDGGDSFGVLTEELWPRIDATWKRERERLGLPEEELPAKIHASSPKSESDPRGHADFVRTDELVRFLKAIAPHTARIDCMLEAKAKDGALFRLMDELRVIAKDDPEVKILSASSAALGID